MVSSPDNEPENHGYINRGEHQGNVYFGLRNAPPPYHQNAIKCHQCQQPTWRDTPDCVYCGADIKCELERMRLRREIRYLKNRIERLSLWLIGAVSVILLSFWLNVMWLTVLGFAACVFLITCVNSLQQYKDNLQTQLYRLN